MLGAYFSGFMRNNLYLWYIMCIDVFYASIATIKLFNTPITSQNFCDNISNLPSVIFNYTLILM